MVRTSATTGSAGRCSPAWLASRGVPAGAAAASRFLAANGLDDADATRLAEDLAPERRLLRSAAQAVPDGPSGDEGLALGARLTGRWAEVAGQEAERWPGGEMHPSGAQP